MPSLFRFFAIVGVLAAIGYGGLYILANHFEPQPKEVTQPLGNVKIRKN